MLEGPAGENAGPYFSEHGVSSRPLFLVSAERGIHDGRVSLLGPLPGNAQGGAYATGGSMMYRLPTKNPMAVGFGFSRAGGKNSAVRFGVAGEF